MLPSKRVEKKSNFLAPENGAQVSAPSQKNLPTTYGVAKNGFEVFSMHIFRKTNTKKAICTQCPGCPSFSCVAAGL